LIRIPSEIPTHWKPRFKIGDRIENNHLIGKILDIFVGLYSSKLGPCYWVRVSHIKDSHVFTQKYVNEMLATPQEVYETSDLKISSWEPYVSPFTGKMV